MSRLPLKLSTVKQLFALSRNQCAYENCNEELVTNKGEVLGEICHIEAAEINGQRYNSKSNDEYRRSFENLILLCSKHHKITNDIKKYSILKLKQIKQAHESKNPIQKFNVSDKIIKTAIDNYMVQNNNNLGANSTQFNNQAKVQNIGTQVGTQNFYNNQEEPLELGNGIQPFNKSLKAKIDKNKTAAPAPAQDVIDFRNDLHSNRPSTIYELPISVLKFRKQNGRIKADVESHEKQFGPLKEADESTQSILKDFLKKIDPEKNGVLKQQIKHKGQLQPAVITCDGFLINGNRRRLILEELYEENHKDAKYQNMRVIILPDNVTIFDIKKLENRYQLQDEGKSEYHGLNRALTLRDNINEQYSLRAQIFDDPEYADKSEKELNSAEQEIMKKFLNPLRCVDRYLKTFNREGLYNTISESAGDKEGRWQAFIDYSNFYYGILNNDAERIKLGIKEDEISKIENAIFKIIRKRNLNSDDMEKALGKLHAFVRGGNLKKYLSNKQAKTYLLNIVNDVNEDIPEIQKKDKEGKKYSERIIDEKWANDPKVKEGVIGNLMKAYKVVHEQIERTKPLELLEDALKKLNHDNLIIEDLGNDSYKDALDISRKISARADEIYNLIDKERGKFKRLAKKKF